MRTLQEKYNGILESKFSKAQFTRDARMELPNLITQFNGFADTVSILKNKGMLSENLDDYSDDALTDMIMNMSRYEDTESEIAFVRKELEKRRSKSNKNVTETKTQEKTGYSRQGVNYSIEALERGVDYELELKGIASNETTTDVEYKKAREKAEKALEKNPNHYLDILAGESSKVDKHDKYVEVTKSNHVDTFNGMKKAELKEAINNLIKEKRKAKKDYDKDGKIESPEAEYKGSKDRAIKKAKEINEVEITDPEFTENVETFYNLQEKILQLKQELKEKESEFGQYKKIIDPIVTSMQRLEDKLGQTESHILRVKRFDYDRTSSSYKDAFDLAITKVNSSTRRILEEALKTTQKVTTVKASYTIDKLEEMSMLGKIRTALVQLLNRFLQIFKKEENNIDIANSELKQIANQQVNEGRKRKIKGGKVVTENDYETGGYVEAMGPHLEKVLKTLVQVWDEWKNGPMTEPGMVPFAKKDLLNYLDNKIDEVEEEVNEQYFDDLEAAKEYARKESEEGYIQHVNKLPKGGYKVEDWLDGSSTTASYQGGEILEADDQKHRQIKEAMKGIISNILKEEVITEAATGNLSKIADIYNDFEGMQSAVNALENIVTDIESYYSNTKDKIQKIYDSFNTIKNPEGIVMGALIGPAIESAFKKDLIPVTFKKGFTAGLKLPQVKMRNQGRDQEKELEEKTTVYSPVNENRKTKYTKRTK